MENQEPQTSAFYLVNRSISKKGYLNGQGFEHSSFSKPQGVESKSLPARLFSEPLAFTFTF
jgi:hypothetical protein